MRTDPDPKLKAAMEEIKAILKKHDITGCVVLNSEDAMEYLFAIEASWACTHYEYEDSRQAYLRIRTTNLPPERKKQVLEATVGMFIGSKDVLELLIRHCDTALQVMGEHVQEIQHRTRRVG